MYNKSQEKIPGCNSRSSSNTLTNDYVYSCDANNAFVDNSSSTSDYDIDKLEYADSLNFWVVFPIRLLIILLSQCFCGLKVSVGFRIPFKMSLWNLYLLLYNILA